MNAELAAPSAVTVDTTAIGNQETRARVSDALGSSGLRCRSVTTFWAKFTSPARVGSIPDRTLVMGDLANIVSYFRQADRSYWVASVRTARPYFLAFVRTERDKKYASLIDDFMKYSDQRLTVCGAPEKARDLSWCLSEAFVALEPDSIADVRYVGQLDSFWVEFRDGLVGQVSLEQVGLEDRRKDLLLASASVGELGKTLVLKRKDGRDFDVDAASIRAVVDKAFATRLSHASQEANVTVGARVRQARERAGLSQAELGRRAGFDQAVISKLERGRHEPRLETLRQIADAMGSDLSEVLLGN